MGCLNSNEGFDHWFGNIHFSGPCNRSCYFCIGQHMMALDPYNNLDKWPLVNLDKFVKECAKHNVHEVNVTGSNTDPLLYRHMGKLKNYLAAHIPNLTFGIRTNGALALGKPNTWGLFDKGSISITSLKPDFYKKTMGNGTPPDLEKIIANTPFDLKVNVVLCPETVKSGDVLDTLADLYLMGIKMVNLREPYGQPHIGNPLVDPPLDYEPDGELYGMPYYYLKDMKVVYWDVHYVEVESVNLYANGEISVDYPITKGHSKQFGEVKGQEHFTKSGRIRDQWVSK